MSVYSSSPGQGPSPAGAMSTERISPPGAGTRTSFSRSFMPATLPAAAVRRRGSGVAGLRIAQGRGLHDVGVGHAGHGDGQELAVDLRGQGGAGDRGAG